MVTILFRLSYLGNNNDNYYVTSAFCGIYGKSGHLFSFQLAWPLIKNHPQFKCEGEIVFTLILKLIVGIKIITFCALIINFWMFKFFFEHSNFKNLKLFKISKKNCSKIQKRNLIPINCSKFLKINLSNILKYILTHWSCFYGQIISFLFSKKKYFKRKSHNKKVNTTKQQVKNFHFRKKKYISTPHWKKNHIFICDKGLKKHIFWNMHEYFRCFVQNSY